MATRKQTKPKAPAKTTNQQGKRQIGKETRENLPMRLERTSTAGSGTPGLKGTMRQTTVRRTRAN